MVYITLAKVRLLTNLSTSDVSDADVTSLITEATKQLNSDINVQVIREPVAMLDRTRENKIDSSNTAYYTRHWHGKFLADRTNDGDVTIADVIIYQVATDGTETTPTINAIDDDDNKITLSSAPTSGVRLFITYNYSPVRELNGSVDSKVELACAFLTAAFCYAKINTGRAPTVAFGTTKITRHMGAYQDYKDRYDEEVRRINSLEEVHSKIGEDLLLR